MTDQHAHSPEGDESPTSPTPLCVAAQIPSDIYDRFSRARKLLITAITGLGILTIALGTQALLSALPQVAADLGTTQVVVNDCLAGYQVMLGLGPLIISPLSTFYGRPAAMALCHVLFTAGTIGISLSMTVSAFAGTLILQAVGTMAAWSLGSAAIADLYRPEERARGVALFYIGGVMGGAISPAITGLFVQYTASSWRGMLHLLAGLSATTFLLQLIFVPNTHHTPTPYAQVRKLTGKKWIFRLEAFNPWVCIRTLKDWRLAAIAVYASFAQYGSFTLQVPLTVTLAPRYGITNVALIGALFLPLGAGDFVGGLVAGKFADWTLIRHAEKRASHQGVPDNGAQPLVEDRLRMLWLGGLILAPGSLLASGWLMQTGAGGIAPVLVLLFINAMGIMLMLVPSNTYILDRAGHDAGGAMSAALFVRMLFSAGASSSILPLIEAVDIGWANTLSAAITVLSFGLVILVIYFRPDPLGVLISSGSPSEVASPTDSSRCDTPVGSSATWASREKRVEV